MGNNKTNAIPADSRIEKAIIATVVACGLGFNCPPNSVNAGDSQAQHDQVNKPILNPITATIHKSHDRSKNDYQGYYDPKLFFGSIFIHTRSLSMHPDQIF